MKSIKRIEEKNSDTHTQRFRLLDLKKWEDIPCFWIECLHMIKIIVLPTKVSIHCFSGAIEVVTNIFTENKHVRISKKQQKGDP